MRPKVSNLRGRRLVAQIALLCLLALIPASAHAKPEETRREVQRHGYVFEKWVRDAFFDHYAAPSYTQEWDVAKEANKKYGDLPVSIKMTKYGSSVDLGDALRQFGIEDEFLIIIGYWQQEGPRKRIVNMVVADVKPALWRTLWQPITLNDLKNLDAVVKKRAVDPGQARVAAHALKSKPPFTTALMTVNPKIDSKRERRLQCSLKFDLVFHLLAPKADASAQANPTLFGIAPPAPFLSAPRSF